MLEWISPFSGEFVVSIPKHVTTIALAVGAGGLITFRGKLPLALTSLALLAAVLAVVMGLHMHIFALVAFPFFAISFNALGRFGAESLERVAPGKGGTAALSLGAAAGLVALLSLGMDVRRSFLRSSPAEPKL